MSSSPTPRRISSRTLARWLSAAALLAAVATAIIFFSLRSRPQPPQPPGENLDGVEPAVAELIRDARSRVREKPDSGSAWGILGEVFFANEMNEESTVCFLRAEALDPKNPRWPYFRAGILLNEGEREQAVTYLERAVDHCDSDETAPRLLLGETLLVLGRLDEAEEHFRGVLAVQPENVRVHFDLGLLAISRQDWKTARDHLTRCLGNPVTQKKSRVQMAIVCRRLGDAKSANEFHEQARSMPVDLDWADSFIAEYQLWAVKKKTRYRLAEFHEAAGRSDEAIAAIKPLLEQYPDDYLPFLSMGRMLGQKGDHQAAEPFLRKAVRLAPDKVQPYYYLSLVLFTKAESKKDDVELSRPLYEEAAGLARKAIERQGDYGFAYMSLGVSLKRLGQRREAIDALRQAVRFLPDKGELHFYLGEALEEDGRLGEARGRLEHALKIAEPRARWRKAAEDRLRSLPKRQES
jgi:tetratricopeptide (TPR) repeat protein